MALLILALLVSLVYSQGVGAEWWTAKFTQTTTATKAGANNGTIRFNWQQKAFSIQFDPSRWGETYMYNTSRGYPASLDGTLSTRSTVGDGCGKCSIALDAHAMPPLAPSLVSSGFIQAAGASGPCTKYVPIKGNQFIKEFTADASKICQLTLTDGRIFDIDPASFQWTNVNIPSPSGCSCDEEMDIYILVDHSASINDPKMAQFKVFVESFLADLEISPSGINVGMGWFHYQTGVNFPMTGDRSTVNAAMAKWWTNCTQPATVTYCNNYPNEPGCVGCQKSATATSTAIQGYKGATSSGNFPSGQMDVTGALDYFYNPADGGSSRKVPKMFVTLTDGAVNHFLNQNGGVGACTFSACSPDLVRAMQALRAKHNSLFSGYSLTTIAMGIGAPGTDPNLSLSPEHLAILAEGNSQNWFTAPDFSNLQSQLRNLLLRSCPAANDLTQQQCLASCCGLCVCGRCQAPSYCIDRNLCTYQELAVCCNEKPVAISESCPTTDKCTNAICNKDIKTGDGYGRCSFTPVDCSAFANGCTKFNCTPSSGQCKTADNSACPPVPCLWGAWGAWEACNVGCGTGTQISRRTQTQDASNGGAACVGEATQTRPCDMGCCPKGCVLSQWSPYSNCTTCDSGTKTRTRTKISDPECGGQACSTTLSETINCPACVNVDCNGKNNTITPCNCVTKVKTLQFQVTTEASGPRGVECKWADDQIFNNVPCTDSEIGQCPVDCVEYWSVWGWCDCNYKTQNRTHTYVSGPKNGGKACDFPTRTYTEQQACNPPASQNCPLYGPVCTNNESCRDSFECTQDRCLMKPDGKLHCDWSLPTECKDNICYSNNTCDNSIGCKNQLKNIDAACPKPNRCYNARCEPKNKNNTGECIITPVNCSGFTGSDPCEFFTCNLADGKCSVSDRSKCPKVDCQWGEWGNWSECSAACGGGTEQRVRSYNRTAKDGGVQCTGDAKETKSGCNPECCVIDCVMNNWQQWSACPTGCDGLGNRTRSATIRTAALCAGKQCLEVINPGLIPNVTCVGGACTWSEECPPCIPRNCTGRNNTNNEKCYCTQDGEDGYSLIVYEVTQSQTGNGTTPCPNYDGEVFNVSCTGVQLAACPKPCLEAWTNWTECSCYTGTQGRSYTILRAPLNGGKTCAFAKNFSESRTCTPDPLIGNCTDIGPLCTIAADCNDELACTIDRCIQLPQVPIGEFHCSWTGNLDCEIDNKCLEGYCDQTVGCKNKTLGAGTVCPPANLCKIPICDVAGAGGKGQCLFNDVNCSGYSGNGVDACEKYDCDGTTGKCTVPNRTLCPPIACTWAEWSNWTACPVSCGNSTVSRTRFVNRTAKDGGVDCVPSDGNQTQACVMNGGCCPVDCEVSEWSAWDASECKVCVPGNQIRTRNITTEATCGGLCVALNDTALSCPPCVPVDCVEQNATSDCRCTQNGTYGEWTITHSISVQPVGPGKPCKDADGKNWTLPCDATAVGKCPTPCEEIWTNWSVCDCFNNSQWQQYNIVKNATNGGVQCSYNVDHLILNQTCTPSEKQNCPNYGPVCKDDSECNDGLACTIDKCILYTPPGTYHCDWSNNLTCNDTSICTTDRCDQLLGCVYDQALFCDDSNNCTIDYCDPVEGCKNENVTCPDLDICNLAYCHETTGCGTVQRNCTGNLSASITNCTIAYCDANYTDKNLDNPCQLSDVCAYFSPLGVGIGAGILALIIVLAILAALLFGGGVVAAATNIPVMNENAVQLNPIYIGADSQADNPLFAEMV